MGIFLLTAGKMCIIIKDRKVVFTVYAHLRELRESLGMTQEEFGKSIGIAKSTYNNYEKGIREPKSDFWVKVAQKYGVTIDYLMGFSDDPHRTSTDISQIDFKEIVKPGKNITLEEFEAIQPIIIEMIKRALFPGYTASPQSSPAPQEGNNATPTQDGPETPPEGK